MTAEFLPKVFSNLCQWFNQIFALPAYVFYLLFYFISSFLISVSDFVLTDGDQIQLYFSKVELGNYITEQMSSVEDDDDVDSEIQMFQNALEFSGVKARDIMSPRTELVAIELFDSIAELKDYETGYSKVVVYQNSLDDIGLRAFV
jgi:CBS domain containing-hemolysin-like protein